MSKMVTKLVARVRRMTCRELVIVAVTVVCPGGLIVGPLVAKFWKA